MVKLEPGTPATIRDNNRYLVLQVIERQGPVSRAELSRITQISEPTIYSIIDHLISKGLVREVGMGQSTGGRKPIMIEFNPEAGLVVGVDAGGTNIKMGISDLGGRFQHTRKIPTKELGFGAEVVPGIARAVRGLMAESGIPQEKVLAVGVAVPGVVHPETGEVSLSPQMGWVSIPFRRLLYEELAIPVVVENDVNAAALAEKHWGAGQDMSDFVFIAIGTGVGGGVIINGELYRGYSYAAGEVGYTITNLSWMKRESSEGFGCLETFTAAHGILKRAAELWGTRAGGGETAPATVEEVFELARAGDEIARGLVEEVADHLAAGIINISVVLSPQAVVIGGGIANAGDVLLQPVKERLQRISPIRPQILLSKMGADTGLIGAASIACRTAKQGLLSI
ncbi:MAG: ROK family transcriptional regulator [Firmicutes bacterium]|nr:ROK family transcriptional regulator [Bacillota bacterium]